MSGFPYPRAQYMLPVFIFHCSYTMPGKWVDSKPELVKHVKSVHGSSAAFMQNVLRSSNDAIFILAILYAIYFNNKSLRV